MNDGEKALFLERKKKKRREGPVLFWEKCSPFKRKTCLYLFSSEKRKEGEGKKNDVFQSLLKGKCEPRTSPGREGKEKGSSLSFLSGEGKREGGSVFTP